MVAITASFEMSSQVGATAVRTRSAARANSSASKIHVAKRSQISRPRISSAVRLKADVTTPVIAWRAP